jgi:hypothetical protein
MRRLFCCCPGASDKKPTSTRAPPRRSHLSASAIGVQVELVHLDNKPIALASDGAGGLIQVEMDAAELAAAAAPPAPAPAPRRRPPRGRGSSRAPAVQAEANRRSSFSSVSTPFPSEARVRPFGAAADAPVESEIWAQQQEMLEAARRLVGDLRTRRAEQSESEVISCGVRPQGDEHPCDVQMELSCALPAPAIALPAMDPYP